jgi:hypothetical protein
MVNPFPYIDKSCRARRDSLPTPEFLIESSPWYFRIWRSLRYASLFSRAFSPFLFIVIPLVAAVLVAPDEIEGMKDFGNRVEGRAIEPHGSEDLTILGIHRTFEQFPKYANLRVRFYLPKVVVGGGPNPSRKVFVEAREIVDIQHYFMQSRQSKWTDGDWNIFTPWPTKDVIVPLDIGSSNLAVVAGYRDGNAPPVFLPVDVLSGSPRTVKPSYTFHFQTSWDLHALEKSIVEPSGHTTSLKTEICTISPGCILYPATSSNAFELDMSSFPEGVYTMHLVGHVPGNSMKPDLTIQIYHRPG